MDDQTTVEIDFNDCWASGGGTSGWLYYEPASVTVGQHLLAVDLYDATLSCAVTVVSRSQYVAFLLPTTLPARTVDESSL